MRVLRSLTSRLVLTTVVLVLAVSILLGAATTLAMRSYLRDQLDHQVEQALRLPPAGGPGAGSLQVPTDVLKRLERELATNRTVQEVLKALETKQSERLAKPLVWNGYPPRQMHGS